MAKTISLNSNLTWPDGKNDYLLSFEGHAIGRIRLAENGWEWYLSIPMELPPWARGQADSLDAARRAFATAWARLLQETNPARLERAWELDRAFEQRRQHMEQGAKRSA